MGFCGDGADDSFIQGLRGVKDGMTEQGATFIDENVISGQNWSGRICRFSIKGKPTWMVCAQPKTTELVYSLMASNCDQDASRKFIDSFKVDPIKAMAAYPADNNPARISSKVRKEPGGLFGHLCGNIIWLIVMPPGPILQRNRKTGAGQ